MAKVRVGLPGSLVWWAPFAAVTAVFVGVVLGSEAARWEGDFGWGMAFLFQALPMVLIVAAFVAAILSARPRGGVGSWLSRAPESPARVLTPMLAAALAWPVGVLFVGALATASVTVRHQGIVDWNYAAMLGAHLAAVVFAVALGTFVGRLLSGVSAAIAAVGLLAAVMFVPAVLGWRNLFEVVGAGHAMPGLTASVNEYVWNAGWLLLASGILLWGSARLLLTHRLGAGVLVVSIILVGAGSAKGADQLMVPSGAEPDRCMGESVVLCVYAGYDSQLDVALPMMEDLYRRARGAGLDTGLLPTSYAQDDYIREPAFEGSLTFGQSAPGAQDFDVHHAALAVSTPLWCEAIYQDEPPIPLLEDMSLVRDWSLLLLDGLTLDEYVERNGPIRGAAAAVPAVSQALQRMNSCVTH